MALIPQTLNSMTSLPFCRIVKSYNRLLYFKAPCIFSSPIWLIEYSPKANIQSSKELFGFSILAIKSVSCLTNITLAFTISSPPIAFIFHFLSRKYAAVSWIPTYLDQEDNFCIKGAALSANLLLTIISSQVVAKGQTKQPTRAFPYL